MKLRESNPPMVFIWTIFMGTIELLALGIALAWHFGRLQ
jgi:hypothetical protein